MGLKTKKGDKAGHLKVTLRLEVDEHALNDLKTQGYATETNPVLANAMYHVDQSMVRTDNQIGVQRALERLKTVRSMREMKYNSDDSEHNNRLEQSGGSSGNASL